MNTWDEAIKLMKEASKGDGMFVSLKNSGDSIEGIFLGEPYVYKQHWSPGSEKVICQDGCELCEDGKKPSSRFKINFFDIKARKVKIFEGGVGWFRNLNSMREEYGLDCIFKIVREGIGRDTKYNFFFKKDLNDDMKKYLAEQATLLELDYDMVESNDGSNAKEDDDDIPF